MESAGVLIELGAVVVGLAILARLASRLAIPAIPLYLLAGLAFGEGGLLPLVTTAEFIEIGAEIGLILLLLSLGLEYSARELVSTLRAQAPAAFVDIALNFSPGFLAGLILGWGVLPAAVLGGVTYVSSSGVVAKLLHDLGRVGNRETPVVLSILVIEDLAMAVYLPMLAGLLIGGVTASGLITAAVAVAGVVVFLAIAQRVEVGLSRVLFSHSDEALLLTILGLAVLVAGIAELVQVSAAVGALLVGIALSGPAAKGARALLTPLRDFLAAIFFAFFGLSVDPSQIPGVLGPALALALLTAATKFATGWWSARRAGVGPRGRARAGATLIPRGEFSIVIAGIAVASGLGTDVGALSIAYVLVLAVVGPVAARVSEPIAERVLSARPAAAPDLRLSPNRTAQLPPGQPERPQDRVREEPEADSGRKR
ncbi:MAG TPA: cation:proton antiporter [Actinomycetota bacterium]|nr:cation:proton antiporter [Actinomycetota bacterium]